MTMSKSKFVGVDGCKGGWFSVGLDNCDGYEVQVFKTFDELLAHYAEACLVLVDIPIGLPQGGEGRDCDPEARKLLGRPRGSSVFPTPTRQTVVQAERQHGDRAIEPAEIIEVPVCWKRDQQTGSFAHRHPRSPR